MKDADHFAVWCYLLLSASHKKQKAIFGNEKITLEEGQLIIGRKKIANDLKISESKVERILNYFSSEQRFEQQSEQQSEQHFERQIEQRKNSKGRLITMKNWGMYQKVNNTFNGQVNSEVNNTLNNVSDTNNNIYNNTNINKTNKELYNINKSKEINNNILVSGRENVAAATPPLADVLAYSLSLGVDKHYATKFFNHYESIGWVNGSGNKIKNWKLVLSNWVAKDKRENGLVPVWFDKNLDEEKMSEEEEANMQKIIGKFKSKRRKHKSN